MASHSGKAVVTHQTCSLCEWVWRDGWTRIMWNIPIESPGSRLILCVARASIWWTESGWLIITIKWLAWTFSYQLAPSGLKLRRCGRNIITVIRLGWTWTKLAPFAISLRRWGFFCRFVFVLSPWFLQSLEQFAFIQTASWICNKNICFKLIFLN